MRKHLAISIIAGLPLFVWPAVLIGQAKWSLAATCIAALGLIGLATLFSLLVFVRLEPSPRRGHPASAGR